MEATRDRKIDHIGFMSLNIEAAKTFYWQVFGWSFEGYGLHKLFRRTHCGRVQASEYNGSSGPMVVIFVDDLDADRQRVRNAGGAISKERFSLFRRIALSFPWSIGNEHAIWHTEE